MTCAMTGSRRRESERSQVRRWYPRRNVPRFSKV